MYRTYEIVEYLFRTYHFKEHCICALITTFSWTQYMIFDDLLHLFLWSTYNVLNLCHHVQSSFCSFLIKHYRSPLLATKRFKVMKFLKKKSKTMKMEKTKMTIKKKKKSMTMKTRTTKRTTKMMMEKTMKRVMRRVMMICKDHQKSKSKFT